MYFKKINNNFIVVPNAENILKKTISNPTLQDFTDNGYYPLVTTEITSTQVLTNEVEKVPYKKEVRFIAKDMTPEELEARDKQLKLETNNWYLEGFDVSECKIRMTIDYSLIDYTPTGSPSYLTHFATNLKNRGTVYKYNKTTRKYTVYLSYWIPKEEEALKTHELYPTWTSGENPLLTIEEFKDL